MGSQREEGLGPYPAATPVTVSLSQLSTGDEASNMGSTLLLLLTQLQCMVADVAAGVAADSAARDVLGVCTSINSPAADSSGLTGKTSKRLESWQADLSALSQSSRCTSGIAGGIGRGES